MSGAPTIDALYRTHGPAVLRRARHILGNEEAARDVLQEIFTDLAARPWQLNDVRSHTGWFYSATTHLCLNRIRNQKTRSRLLRERAISLFRPTPPPAPERRAVGRQLLMTLPEELARVSIYYHMDGMTQAEIAPLMGCSRRKVGALLERLREHLDSDCEEVV